MAIYKSLTGSYPPIYDPHTPFYELNDPQGKKLVQASINRAIQDQKELGIDVLVDGQVRADIVSLFCQHIDGFAGQRLPYHVVKKVGPSPCPITVDDYLTAREQAGNLKVKAHLTGPMTLARDAVVDMASGYSEKTDPSLVMDIAVALGEEAKCLVRAGAEIIQIDEPVLRNGVDLALAFRAMQTIIDIGSVPVSGLHICGNFTNIIESVLSDSPVNYVSVEGSWLLQDELKKINRQFLSETGKQICLGCISVADYTVERIRTVQSFLDQMFSRLGPENIWAITPNCGMRLMPYEIAKQKIKIMVEAARSLE